MTSLDTKRRRWRRHLDRMRDEQVDPLVHHLTIFRAFQETVGARRTLTHEGATELADWIAVNYIAFSSMWIRKTAERSPARAKKKKRKKKRRPDRRSLSLCRLLEELLEEPDALTYKRFRRMFHGKKLPERIIRQQWERNFGTGQRLSQRDVKRDIRSVEQATQNVKKFVDKQVAHTGLNRRLHVMSSFGEIREAVERLDRVFRKYQLLISGRVPQKPDLQSELDGVRELLRGLWREARS